MRTPTAWLSMCVLGVTALGCQREEQPVASHPASESPASPAPTVALEPGTSAPLTTETGLSGSVLETMDAGKYTYVRLQTDKGEVWAAGPQTAVKVGQHVRLVGEMPITNFESKTLGRTFESILFVTEIVIAETAGSPASVPAHHPPMGGARQQKRPAERAAIRPGTIATADGGFTVADLFDRRESLNGRRVSIRAQVVRSTPNIMDRNWLHIQDGTGQEHDFDLAVTTKDTAAVGDIVLVSGTLAKDKDVGAGYFFPLIIEDAEVKVEGRPTGK